MTRSVSFFWKARERLVKLGPERCPRSLRGARKGNNDIVAGLILIAVQTKMFAEITLHPIALNGISHAAARDQPHPQSALISRGRHQHFKITQPHSLSQLADAYKIRLFGEPGRFGKTR